MKKTLATILLCISALPTAYAEMTARQMLQNTCSSGLCDVYIKAYVTGYITSEEMVKASTGKYNYVCRPSSVMLSEVAAQVKNRVQNSPALLNESAEVAFTVAMQQLYPCP